MGDEKYAIVIVGAGRVGTAVGNLLQKRGYRVIAAVAASQPSLDKAAPLLPGVHLLRADDEAVARAAREADVVLITTKDEQIAPACSGLVERGAITPGHTVMHMSGAGSLDLLASAQRAGAKTASIHPIQSFASAELAIEKLPGSYFGVTAEPDAREAALEIVRDLGGIPIEVADENKPLYHAAASIASNYLVALVNLAARAYQAAGFADERAALEAMMPLVKGTVANVERVGTVAALTGPIARGDIGVVRQHVAAMQKLGDEAVTVYKALGRQTIHIAVEKGTLTPDAAAELADVLKDGRDR